MINTPFNYTGSKFNLLHQILPLFDYSKPNMVDVFVGGGSVYTNVVNKYNRILINDILPDLVEIHKKLINDPDRIIADVKALAICKESQELYNSLRESYNNEKTPEKLWALMLSCTNNMMRLNSKLKFNQTWGKRGWNSSVDNKVRIFVEHISKYKNKIYFNNSHFSELEIHSNCFYYLDPPYGSSKNADGTISNQKMTEAGYNAYFTKEDDIKLYNYCKNLHQSGATFMLSGVSKHNDKTSWLLDKLIQDGFKYTELVFDYNKVSKKGQKDTLEVIIKNY